VGKSTVAWEVSQFLQAASIAHCLIEGDLMGQVHPAPTDDPDRSAITERNLAAVWANFAALGHHRLIYTNTVSVLETDMFQRALGAESLRIVRVLLTADDATAGSRLAQREIGSQLEPHIQRSVFMARHLAEHSPADTVRVPTDGRPILDIARHVLTATGW
jgi:hypothetical protein